MNEPGSLIRSLAGRPVARNFHSYVINEIGSAIVAGRFPVGSSLPNDAEMSSKFDVSRTVLREAIKTLEAKGLVEARPKVGTKVSPKSRWNYFDHTILAWQFAAGIDETLLQQMTSLRLAMEPQAAAAIANSRTADDLRLMNYWIKQMERSLTSPLNFAIADFEFHVAIADVHRNPFLRSLLGVMELVHCSVYQPYVSQDQMVDKVLLADHAALLRCIEKGDSTGAQKACKKLIELEYQFGRQSVTQSSSR